MMNDPRLLRQVELHPYPLLFATISGAHLYGFPSPDSDFDLRGVHLLPLTALNDALRGVINEGVGLAAISTPVLLLGIWGFVCGAIALRIFRWD